MDLTTSKYCKEVPFITVHTDMRFVPIFASVLRSDLHYVQTFSALFRGAVHFPAIQGGEKMMRSATDNSHQLLLREQIINFRKVQIAILCED